MSVLDGLVEGVFGSGGDWSGVLELGMFVALRLGGLLLLVMAVRLPFEVVRKRWLW